MDKRLKDIMGLLGLSNPYSYYEGNSQCLQIRLKALQILEGLYVLPPNILLLLRSLVMDGEPPDTLVLSWQALYDTVDTLAKGGDTDELYGRLLVHYVSTQPDGIFGPYSTVNRI